MSKSKVQRKLTVGISISLSGKYRLQGRQALRGLQLWSAYANRNGGIYLAERAQSLPVELVAYNDASKTDRARDNVARLVREDRVDFLLAPYSSVLTMAVAPVAESHKKILWDHGGASDAIFQQSWRYLVGVLSPASRYLRSLPRYLLEKKPALRRIACLRGAAGTFASETARGLVEAATPHGVAVREALFDSPIEHPGEIIRTLLRDDPDLLVAVGAFQDDVKIARRCVGRKPVVAMAAGVRAFGRALGVKAEGIIGPSQWESAVRYPDLRGPDSAWFSAHFQERFGERPDYTAAQAFAAGVIVREAVQLTGGLNDDRLRQAAADLDIHTFYGAFRIDPKTGLQIGHRPLLVQWQNGEKVVIWPPEAAQSASS